MTKQKRVSLDDPTINVTVEKTVSRRRSLSTSDFNYLKRLLVSLVERDLRRSSAIYSKDTVKHSESIKQLSETQNQTLGDVQSPKLEDFAKYLTQSYPLKGQQKVLIEELARASKENIGLLQSL